VYLAHKSVYLVHFFNAHRGRIGVVYKQVHWGQVALTSRTRGGGGDSSSSLSSSDSPSSSSSPELLLPCCPSPSGPSSRGRLHVQYSSSRSVTASADWQLEENKIQKEIFLSVCLSRSRLRVLDYGLFSVTAAALPAAGANLRAFLSRSPLRAQEDSLQYSSQNWGSFLVSKSQNIPRRASIEHEPMRGRGLCYQPAQASP